MGDKTAIEWTDATWNAIVGCSKTSPGCINCYAIGVTHRGLSPHHQGLTIRTPSGTDWNGTIHQAPDSIFYKPLAWKRPRRIFVNSLSDLFHDNVKVRTIVEVFAIMSLAPQHTFQLLTKRSKRMAAVLGSDEFPQALQAERLRLAARPVYPGNDPIGPLVWPLPNVHVGVSIESDRYTFRADHLRATPAAVRWISAEPLLGPLPSLNLDEISWVVVGGESGPGARPMNPAWVRDLRDRCIESGDKFCGDCGDMIVRGFDGTPVHCVSVAHHDYDHRAVDDGTGTDRPAFLFKQWGSWTPQARRTDPWWDREPDAWVNEATGETVLEGDPKLDEGSWTGVWRANKNLTGRELDCQFWDEYPAARA